MPVWLPPEPVFEQPSRDRIAPRQAEFLIVLMGEQPGFLEPARIFQFAVIDLDARAARAGMEAEHQRGREGPGLGGVIDDLVERDLGLFIDLARHRLFEALARLDETGKRRE